MLLIVWLGKKGCSGRICHGSRRPPIADHSSQINSYAANPEILGESEASGSCWKIPRELPPPNW
ncbi:MAG: hypothetical protein MUP74_01415, partial [Desulfobacterales bacterium]|nr:hypothetical protein [Desulfobacterales bacterium]